MFSASYILLPLLLVSYVSAHGFVHEISVEGGPTLTGAVPSDQRQKGNFAIRQIKSAFPNKGAKNPALNCGPGAFAASAVATIQPGAKLSFDWRAADLNAWPHDTGPSLTYLASCGNTPCNEFDSTKAKWFKIGQQGQKPNSNKWFQGDLMKGAKATATIPSNIAPGNYLIRHEIIALHLAIDKGGAEFYPACAQVKIGGSGTGTPSADELVSFPGAYSDTDPGIFLPDNSQFSKGNYKFPGPAIAKLAASNGNAGAPADTTTKASGTSGSAKPTSTKSANSVGATKACKLRKSKTTKAAREAAAAPTAEVYPRHMSRVMRRLAFDGLDAGAHQVSA
ncbi:hypothetical protein D9611_012859 [Ephemerocybe angulata]|uniref:lytic cellulose monooxygenase (C4-dehydrogenating) n=1 Tax=Ephemerocybe angulata TaxID=980116 RepID=A0A8H5BAP1_9AGAR|nr:hypothetical protein D9611_012859 [Tulosesus angulatus]